MIRLLDTTPQVAVSPAEYLRLLGYPPDHVPGDRVRELMAWARAWFAAHGRPWLHLSEASCENAGGGLRLDGVAFPSQQLRDHLAGTHATRVVLVAVSAGRACEEEARRCWENSKPDEYFFLEVFASAVVEHLVASANARICAAAEREGMVALPHHSPGYAGWDVAGQGRLFEVIARSVGQAFPEPLEVLSTGMLRPKKSLLAVVGLAQRGIHAPAAASLIACERCGFSPCQYRRASYKFTTPRIDGTPVPASAPAPRYTVNARALQKWARERVRLEPRDDGAVVAHFRFDGTTCSNIGHPLAFDYRVVLGPAGEGRRILEAGCAPAPGDAGHERMCAFLADAPRLMEAIAAERPLVGRPLDAVLTWERPSAPSGCYCEAKTRTHKWGIALEVIHHALAHAGATESSSMTASLLPCTAPLPSHSS